MGLRDAFSKPGGGGRLNNVAGTITELEFSTTFPYQAKNKSDKKKSDFNSLWCNMAIRTDGAEEAVVEPIFSGDADVWDISEDGHSVSPKEGAERMPQLFGSITRLLGSMIDHDFPEPEYDADNGVIDLSSLVNQRFTFVQVVDAEATKKFGKIKDKKDPAKSYDRKTTEVSEYLGESDGDATPAKATKTTATSKSAKGGKTNGAAKAESDELMEYADSVLVDLLGKAKGNTIAKSALSALISRKLLGNPKRNSVHKLLVDEKYQGREEGWTDNGDSLELA